MNRTPHGAVIPGNSNQLGRAPRIPNLNDPQVREFFTAPGLVARLRNLEKVDPQTYQEVCLVLDQHERAMSGSRSAPGAWNGRDDQPYEPMPFQPTEEYHPAHTPGTKDHDTLRTAVENANAGVITEQLQARLSEPTTWDRLASPNERAARMGDGEPSLRESISAAASLDYPKE